MLLVPGLVRHASAAPFSQANDNFAGSRGPWTILKLIITVTLYPVSSQAGYFCTATSNDCTVP